MRHAIIGFLFSIVLLSGCELKASYDSTPSNPGLKMKEANVDMKVDEAVVMCQNVEMTQTKEKTETRVKFEGFQHVERGNFGQRNVSHCIPCEKAHSAREKKVCEGDGEGTEK